MNTNITESLYAMALQRIEELLPEVLRFCDFVLGFEGEIPGARPEECGNYSEQSLPMAKYYIRKYRDALTETPRFTYPD